ncbi:MAG: hypothetical protein ACE5JR_01790 [Gemmatimonadota bacterium]
MGTPRKSAVLALLLAGGLAACGDSPTEPDPSAPGIGGDVEAQVAGDSLLAAVALEDIALSLGASPDAITGPLAEAEGLFDEARLASLDGDPETARRRAREARLELARHLLETRGEEVVDELFARVETIRDRLAEASAEFDRIDQLEQVLTELLEQARAFEAEGQPVHAVERLILALQVTDHFRLRHDTLRHITLAYARLQIARGIRAVELSARLIGDDPTPVQERIQAHAVELVRRAQAVLEFGALRRAALLSWRGQEYALIAVLGAERPTQEDARLLLEVATRLIEEARAAIGEDPTPAQEAILALAIRLREAGIAKLESGQWRGVGLLWQSAVTAAVLVSG